MPNDLIEEIKSNEDLKGVIPATSAWKTYFPALTEAQKFDLPLKIDANLSVNSPEALYVEVVLNQLLGVLKRALNYRIQIKNLQRQSYDEVVKVNMAMLQARSQYNWELNALEKDKARIGKEIANLELNEKTYKTIRDNLDTSILDRDVTKSRTHWQTRAKSAGLRNGGNSNAQKAASTLEKTSIISEHDAFLSRKHHSEIAQNSRVAKGLILKAKTLNIDYQIAALKSTFDKLKERLRAQLTTAIGEMKSSINLTNVTNGIGELLRRDVKEAKDLIGVLRVGLSHVYGLPDKNPVKLQSDGLVTWTTWARNAHEELIRITRFEQEFTIDISVRNNLIGKWGSSNRQLNTWKFTLDRTSFIGNQSSSITPPRIRVRGVNLSVVAKDKSLDLSYHAKLTLPKTTKTKAKGLTQNKNGKSDQRIKLQTWWPSVTHASVGSRDRSSFDGEWVTGFAMNGNPLGDWKIEIARRMARSNSEWIKPNDLKNASKIEDVILSLRVAMSD